MLRRRVEAKKTWDKKQVDIKNILRMGYNDFECILRMSSIDDVNDNEMI